MKKIFGLSCTAKSVMAMKCGKTDASISILVNCDSQTVSNIS